MVSSTSVASPMTSRTLGIVCLLDVSRANGPAASCIHIRPIAGSQFPAQPIDEIIGSRSCPGNRKLPRRWTGDFNFDSQQIARQDVGDAVGPFDQADTRSVNELISPQF